MKPCSVEIIYATPSEIKDIYDKHKSSLGLEYDEQAHAVYLPRAVSSLPDEIKPFVNSEYAKLVRVVEKAGLVAKLPVELKDVDVNRINSLNHQSLHESKLMIPFIYTTCDKKGSSDGRGWEMGYASGRKIIIPVTYRGQPINIPSIRLDFQLPIIIESVEKDALKLQDLLREMTKFDLATGRCKMHGDTLLGRKDGAYFCLKGMAEQYFDLVPVRNF